MRSSSKYNFDDVLVAETKLLAQTKSTDRQPQVLVLRSRLDKCHDRYLNSTSTSNNAVQQPSAACSACCLKVEASEFKRRSSFEVADSTECFAICGERRAIDVQVDAKSPLSGNLVILALTRTKKGLLTTINGQQDDDSSGSILLSCYNENSWSFLKFDLHKGSPSEQTQQRQAHYSRLMANQAPSILISSLDIQWDSVKRKEIVSMAVQPNRRKKSQQIVSKETLLVDEFSCHKVNNNSFSQSEQQATYPEQVVKIHLVILINPDSTTATIAALKGKSGSEPSGVEGSLKNFNDILPEAYIDYPGQMNLTTQSKRATLSNSTLNSLLKTMTTTTSTTTTSSSTTTSTTTTTMASVITAAKRDLESSISEHQVEEFSANQSALLVPMISERMDLPNKQQLGRSIVVVPTQGKATETKPSNDSSTRIISAHSYLAELESIGLRFRSSSFLAFTVWSSFVILTYTLCLLIYLKSRRRFRASKKCSMKSRLNRAGRKNVSAQLRQLQVETTNSSNGNTLNISEPFNLQMPPETRARLMTMLASSRTKTYAKRQQEQQASNSPPMVTWKSELISETSESASMEQQEIHLKEMDSFEEEQAFELSNMQEPPPANELPLSEEPLEAYENNTIDSNKTSLNNSPQHSLKFAAYRTINVVRALRQAATLARSRFQSSRYRPNLNVILESDLEYLQATATTTTASPSSPLSRSSLFPHESGEMNELATILVDVQPDRVSPDLFDSLVQDAMSRECSHIVGKFYINRPQSDQTATLFSKPLAIRKVKCVIMNEQSVSRSRILRQVKQDGFYEEHNGAAGAMSAAIASTATVGVSPATITQELDLNQ